MIFVRRSEHRGEADHGWLKSKHTFSFANYYDEKFMGFGALRVINEDRVSGGAGFDRHGHRDMEIISYVIDGALRHQDSMGNSSIIRPGEIQRMSAGTGVQHSEYNELNDKVTHFLQIWILPEKMGITPGYGQRSFASELARADLVLLASKDGRENSITLNQEACIYAVKSDRDDKRTLPASFKRRYWLQVIRGEVIVEGERLRAGDGAGISQVATLPLQWSAGSEFLLLDLP